MRLRHTILVIHTAKATPIKILVNGIYFNQEKVLDFTQKRLMKAMWQVFVLLEVEVVTPIKLRLVVHNCSSSSEFQFNDYYKLLLLQI
jgi:hypothetical protein